MSRAEQAIFTVLVLVTDSQGRMLVENRLDPDWPGICLPGGHVEPEESFTQAAVRETREETGLTILDPKLCGVKQFQTRRGERYVVFFYRATQFQGRLQSSAEGEVLWMTREEVLRGRTVPDLDQMLKVFETEELNEFYYYREGDSWGLKLL